MNELPLKPSQNHSHDASLHELRQQIDAIDGQLVELMAQRIQVTGQVGELKSRLGQPLYVPEREQVLLAARRQQAEELGLSPELAEDVLRRVMRESYLSQTGKGFKKVRDDDRPVVIIGGRGQLGQVFVQWFELSGYQVHVIDKHNLADLANVVADAALVLIGVPINSTEGVIANLPKLPEDCVLADLTSVKTGPLAAMLAAHTGPVVGLHPMFGPNVSTLAKQLVVMTEGRAAVAADWLQQQLRTWGLRIEWLPAAQHDQAMSLIQVMRHITTFAYGVHLMEEAADLQQLQALSSPIYRLELTMVGRLFAQSPTLYADIILAEPDNFAMIRRYLARFAKLLDELEQQGKPFFVETFDQVAKWFGEDAEQFLNESSALLQRANDAQVPERGL